MRFLLMVYYFISANNAPNYGHTTTYRLKWTATQTEKFVKNDLNIPHKINRFIRSLKRINDIRVSMWHVTIEIVKPLWQHLTNDDLNWFFSVLFLASLLWDSVGWSRCRCLHPNFALTKVFNIGQCSCSKSYHCFAAVKLVLIVFSALAPLAISSSHPVYASLALSLYLNHFAFRSFVSILDIPLLEIDLLNYLVCTSCWRSGAKQQPHCRITAAKLHFDKFSQNMHISSSSMRTT